MLKKQINFITIYRGEAELRINCDTKMNYYDYQQIKKQNKKVASLSSFDNMKPTWENSINS